MPPITNQLARIKSSDPELNGTEVLILETKGDACLVKLTDMPLAFSWDREDLEIMEESYESQ